MLTKDKCTKCNRLVKDGLHCTLCDCAVHTKCINASDECTQIVSTIKNIVFFCDSCLLVFDGIKSFNNLNTKMSKEIEQLVETNKTILTHVDSIDKFSVDSDTFKKDLNLGWSEVLKKELNHGFKTVSSDVKSVQLKLDEEVEIKKREIKALIFGLSEDSEDKIVVEKIFKYLSDNAVDTSSFKFKRIGQKKSDNPRPVWIVFHEVEMKRNVFNNVRKI